MSILEKITPVAFHKQIHQLHETVETKPYLQRYLSQDSLTLLDHYRYLTQLHELYKTFATRMQHPTFKPVFPTHLTYLLERAGRIQADLNFLKSHIAFKNKDAIISATDNYTDMLKKIPHDDNGNLEFLTHFLVSILGDLNGGALVLKNKVKKLYEKSALPIKDHEGTSFYQFPKTPLNDLDSWLKHNIPYPTENELTSEYPAEKYVRIGKATVAAFQHHTAIVEQLEATRVHCLPNLSQSVSPPKKHAYSPGLFNCNKIGKAVVGVTVAAVATAGLVYRFT